MEDVTGEMNGGESEKSIGRRRLLAAVGAVGAGGLAGCSGSGGGDAGDDEGGGGGDGGSGGGDGASGGYSCTDITNGYKQQDVGERPILFDFEYPAMFDELLYTQAGPLSSYNAEQSIGEDRLIEISINQATDPESSGGGGGGGASATTIQFNGEEVEFAGISTASELSWTGELPYQFDGERRTLAMWMTIVVDKESNECGDALREAADHIVSSLAVNPESTLGN